MMGKQMVKQETLWMAHDDWQHPQGLVWYAGKAILIKKVWPQDKGRPCSVNSHRWRNES
jgi:hypothetical protein